jgi:hypothetical protein
VALPLDVLLSHAVLDLTRAAERIDPTVNVVRWSDFLRVVDGSTKKTLHLDARISKRTIPGYVTSTTRAGGLTVDARGTFHLTDAGNAVRDAWGAVIRSACDGFEAQHGDALRQALTTVVAGLELEMPHYLHPYGTVDPSVAGGVDWKRVPRDRAADTTSDLSILALLSQALTAYSMQYEKRGGALLWAVHLARDGRGPMPFGSTFERHRFDAQAWGGAYVPLTAAIEASWSDAPALRAALEGIDVHDRGHADHPYVVHIPGGGFVEVSGRADRAPG